MVEVGLTGGIGSGKSEVSRLLESYGAVVIDADKLARDVVAPGTPGLAQVVEEFGADVVRADGSLDRERLASLVFGDDGARQRLNAIVHPLVGERSAALKADASDDAVVVHDVPLLTEAGLAGLYDLVVVVDVPVETQIERLVQLRGITEEDARARIAVQASRDERRAVADVVIDNSGTFEELEAQVRELWEELRLRV
jgi:dephospho-CoA kinase